jgi:hypothetical protein
LDENQGKSDITAKEAVGNKGDNKGDRYLLLDIEEFTCHIGLKKARGSKNAENPTIENK